MGALSIPATLDDPTLEFMARLGDESLWHIRRGVPVFKCHDRKRVGQDGKPFVAYSVTARDLDDIAMKMRRNQAKGVPARMTVGHINPDGSFPESDQPEVVGYWLNARRGTFGPQNEPCVLCDGYVKSDAVELVRGRPYRSSEFYPASKEIRGIALLTRDPELDLGSVELYAIGKGWHFASSPGVFYMADEKEPNKEEAKEEKLGEEQATEGEPEGHAEWLTHMQHYSKKDPVMMYAAHCYAENAGGPAMAGATNEQIPTPNPGEKEDEVMSRMQRDDQTVNYARLESQMNKLAKQCEVYQQQIGKLTKERDLADCERMFRTLQAEHYQLKDSCEEFVKELLPLSADERAKRIAFIRKYVPRDMADGAMPLEVYQGSAETRPAPKGDPSPKQIGELVRRFQGKPEEFDKALNELKNGQSVQN